MSASLNHTKTYNTLTPSFRYGKDELASIRLPHLRYSLPHITSDAEVALVVKAVISMAILGISPLILFHIVHFFCPDLFLVPITPN